MADAYKLKADASFPRVIREATTIHGETVQETEGFNYQTGGYVLAENMTPRDRERAENGDLDHILEPADRDEALAAIDAVEHGTFIPDHEAEAFILEGYGHHVVPRDQVLELKSAGADDAKAALEASRKDGADERPNLTAREVPSLAEASEEGKSVVPDTPDNEKVDEDTLRGVEQPPGLAVGKDKAEAEGAEAESPKRQRPQRQQKKEESTAGAQSDKKDE
jgi:hypothetical protein